MIASKQGRTGVSVNRVSLLHKTLANLFTALHFKLDVCEIPDENGGKSTEIEVTYTPILDAQRDEQLIVRLPSFMKEEISFPHANCAKFYTRLANTLQV